jgi:hypothetical protein
MSRSRSVTSVVCTIAVALMQAGTALGQDDLDERPLQLPSLGDREACPISAGSRTTVPVQQHIFGAAGLWLGSGPAYFLLAWKASPDDDATFALEPVPYEHNAYRAKTPWVSVPSYLGPVLVRGHALDTSGRALRFAWNGSEPTDQLRLQAPRAPGASLWSFWPAGMWVPGPGCYGVQIDTLVGSDIVVFEATAH